MNDTVVISAAAMSTTDIMRERLAALQPESVEILDESGLHIGHVGARDGGGHYQLIIVSPLFAQQSMQARHRMVYSALADLLQKKIHALAIKAYAPGEI